MHKWLYILWAALWSLASLLQASADEPQTVFRIYVTNDNCPDYTWGLDEKATRLAYANIVKSHLDAMAATGNNQVSEQDHYNMAVTNEYLAFVERYPERQKELDRHGDIDAKSGSQAAGFAQAIVDFNRGANGRVQLINSTGEGQLSGKSCHDYSPTLPIFTEHDAIAESHSPPS